MMNYTTNYQFPHIETINNVISIASRDDKFYYLRAGWAPRLPIFLKQLNSYMLMNNVAVYVPSKERITRSTGVDYYFSTLTSVTKTYEELRDGYTIPLLFRPEDRNAFGITDCFGIHLIEVVGQIQYVFDTKIAEWARENNATEILGVSLALKLTPKHRIRVYTRNNHIIVFTTKGLSDAPDTDYKLYRKLWACIPLIRGWNNPDVLAEEEPRYTDITRVCKLLDNDDATEFWRTLEQLCNTCEAFTDLKYANIITTFNNISNIRLRQFEVSIQQHDARAQEHLRRYTDELQNKREACRRLLEMQTNNVVIEPSTIKLLVDKQICYCLNTSNIRNNEGKISFRCSAPLLAYDKNAAVSLYKRKISNGAEDPKVLNLFKLLFVDEKVMLMFDQAIDLSLSNGAIEARGGYTRMGNDFNQCLPNPHHYNFNCWGSYAPVITKLVNEFKLEEVFYQIKAAVGSFNFSDPPVVSRFFQHLEAIVCGDYNPRCFYWRDENCTTPHNYTETIQHFREEITE